MKHFVVLISKYSCSDQTPGNPEIKLRLSHEIFGNQATFIL